MLRLDNVNACDIPGFHDDLLSYDTGCSGESVPVLSGGI
jgi:hypothetical protein